MSETYEWYSIHLKRGLTLIPKEKGSDKKKVWNWNCKQAGRYAATPPQVAQWVVSMQHTTTPLAVCLQTVDMFKNPKSIWLSHSDSSLTDLPIN